MELKKFQLFSFLFSTTLAFGRKPANFLPVLTRFKSSSSLFPRVSKHSRRNTQKTGFFLTFSLKIK